MTLYMRSYLRQMEPVCIPASLPRSLGFYSRWHLLRRPPVLCSGYGAVGVPAEQCRLPAWSEGTVHAGVDGAEELLLLACPPEVLSPAVCGSVPRRRASRPSRFPAVHGTSAGGWGRLALLGR